MKFAKVMFLHLSVNHSVHREEEYLGRYPPRQVHPLTGTRPGQVPSRQVQPPARYTHQAGTPPGRYTPQQVHPCQVQPLAVTPLWAGTPPAGTPPRAGTPPDRYPPPLAGTSPSNACWDTVNKRAVRILLECILVIFEFSSATT